MAPRKYAVQATPQERSRKLTRPARPLHLFLFPHFVLAVLAGFAFAEIALGQASRTISVFIDRDVSGLQAINLSQAVAKQHPDVIQAQMRIAEAEAWAMGTGAMAIAAGVDSGPTLSFEFPDLIVALALSVPGEQPAGAPWQLWGSGMFYLESVDLRLEPRSPAPPPAKAGCMGVLGNVEFRISETSAPNPVVEVISKKKYVWVMAGIGDSSLGPWLPAFPSRSNFKGDAKHSFDGSRNHWQFQVPRTYPITSVGGARLYFMVNAAKDNPFTGDIADWCDPYVGI